MRRAALAVAEITVAAASDLCLRYRICRRRVERKSGGCRGLCGPCYRGVNKLINDNVFTEEELVRKGRILPLQQSVKQWCAEG